MCTTDYSHDTNVNNSSHSPTCELDIHVIWHPNSSVGEPLYNHLVGHYHSDTFAGFTGSPIEVFACTGKQPHLWHGEHNDTPAPRTVLIPIIDPALVRGCHEDSRENPWYFLARELTKTALSHHPDKTLITIPIIAGTRPSYEPLKALTEGIQGINLPESLLQHLSEQSRSPMTDTTRGIGSLIRDINQSILQRSFLDSHKLTVFISHARADLSSTETPENGRTGVVATIKKYIDDATHIDTFFDTHTIQVGSEWQREIKTAAASCALLMVRTNSYSLRPWTQTEVKIAKEKQRPIVCLSALVEGEKRGSFIMDHVPTVAYPVHSNDDEKKRDAVNNAINMLVDEALKFRLWKQQSERIFADVPTLASAPDPIALSQVVADQQMPDKNPQVQIVYPDPPLTSVETAALTRIFALGHPRNGTLALNTPRTHCIPKTNAEHADIRIAFSVSVPEELSAYGITDTHIERTVAEVAQLALIKGARLTYAGTIGENASCLTTSILDTIDRYQSLERYVQATSSGMHRPGNARHALTLTIPRCALTSEQYKAAQSVQNKYPETVDVKVLDISGTCTELDEAQQWRDSVESRQQAFTAIRAHLPAFCDARAIIGGKLQRRDSQHPHGYQGILPGIIDEALATVRARQPLYLAGGFGGAAALLAWRMGYINPPAAHTFEQLLSGNEALAKAVNEINQGITQTSNGLSKEDNRRMCSTRHPSDFARYVAKGLSEICRTGEIDS